LLTLILRTNANNEHSNGDCDFAYVEIDEALARKVRARQELFSGVMEKDDDTHVLHFWDASCRYFKRDVDDVESFVTLLDGVSDGGFAQVEAAIVPEKYFEDRGSDSLEQRTEGDMLVIEERGFSWKCYPKYFDGVEIATDLVPYDVLKKVL
jgi:hypothetical protein